MTCENCGAPARLDPNRGIFVCDYCGGEFVPPAGEDGVQVLGETKFPCAACEGRLSDGQLEMHPLLYCTACRGMLVSMEDFGPILEAVRSQRSWPAVAVGPRNTSNGKVPRLCPRCRQAMDHHPYGGPGNVIIDTCENCSVNWLDKGELQRIAAAPDHTYQEALVSPSVKTPNAQDAFLEDV